MSATSRRLHAKSLALVFILAVFLPHPVLLEAIAATDSKAEAAAIPLCEHGVPPDLCTRCDPSLAAAFQEMGDWCNKHELPLSHCRQCNPKLTFSASEPLDWCNEHAVPESMCTKCHSELVAKFIAAGDYCREHGFPKSICPRCNPQLLLERGVQLPPFPEPGLKVRLASADTARDAGLETVVVQPQPFSPTIEVVGQIQFDQNRLAQLSPRADAVVRAIHADIGDSISDGQALIELASAAVGEDQARLAAARARIEAAKATLAREESLSKSGISPRKSVEAARTELAAAQAEHESARSALGAAGAGPETERGRYVLTAPFAGTVVARDAVIGRTATSGQVLMEIADLSTMWVILEVPELEASRVQVGQKVTLRFNSLSDEVRQSTVGRVASSIDPETRTMHARVDLPNLDRKLKAGTLVRAGIHVADERQVLVVPEGAVQQVEGHSLVFVKESAAVYAPVAVTAGAKANQSIEIVDGLAPGSEIVTVGAFLLKTEVLKDSIGAGCCEGGAE